MYKNNLINIKKNCVKNLYLELRIIENPKIFISTAKKVTQNVFFQITPRSVPEFLHTRNRKGAKYVNIDKNGICDPSKVQENRKVIDWKA